MHLLSIASAFPKHEFTQNECYHALASTPTFQQLRSSSQGLLDKILNRPGAIHSRQFATPDIPELVAATPDHLNRYFEREATQLACKALQSALVKAHLKPSELDALILCTCTGYLCPGLTSHVAEQAGLRPDTYLQDIVGLGCGAAIPTLRSAKGFLAAQPEAKVAVIAVELCSAAFYLDDDPGVLISLCLFGDGASASIWTQYPNSLNSKHWRCDLFNTVHQPQYREKIRFENRNGYLRNLLDREVPQLAANAVFYLAQIDHASPETILSHGGGREVLDAIEEKFPCTSPILQESRQVLRQHGNLSSPSVLVALEHRLSQAPSANNTLWLTSFGAGFAAHSCQLTKCD